MKTCVNCLLFAAGVLLTGALAGCRAQRSARPDLYAADAAAFAAPTGLTATLVDSINIDLKWRDNASDEAGYFVEGYFVGQGPAMSKEFVIIDALPPNTTTFRHALLLPETRFVYRVRPVFGRASNTAEIVTGKPGPQRSPEPETPGAATPAVGEVKYSLRSTLTEDLAAPTDLRATLIPPVGARLEWKDHAADEDEYLVEVKAEWAPDFKVSMFFERDTMSLTSYEFPPETRFAFRVRAFFYGQPSNEAEQTTGPDPEMNAPKGKAPPVGRPK